MRSATALEGGAEGSVVLAIKGALAVLLATALAAVALALLATSLVGRNCLLACDAAVGSILPLLSSPSCMVVHNGALLKSRPQRSALIRSVQRTKARRLFAIGLRKRGFARSAT